MSEVAAAAAAATTSAGECFEGEASDDGLSSACKYFTLHSSQFSLRLGATFSIEITSRQLLKFRPPSPFFPSKHFNRDKMPFLYIRAHPYFLTPWIDLNLAYFSNFLFFFFLMKNSAHTGAVYIVSALVSIIKSYSYQQMLIF